MNIYFRFLAVLTMSGTLLLNSCAKKGCTDYVSDSYDSDATEDDGSCVYYYGGKNYGQLDVGVVINSNQQYDIYFDGTYIGRLLHYWPSGLSCAQPDAIGKVLTSGFHTVRAIGVVGGDIREESIYLDPQECLVVLIEDLQLITGGGSAGYVCSGGNCSYVSSGADYASLSDCQSNCGSSTGNLTFWVNQDLGCGNIYVSVTSYGTGTIDSYYSSMPDCGDSGCANFSGLGLGAYYYSVTSDGSCTWSGNVQVTSGCNLLQLTM